MTHLSPVTVSAEPSGLRCPVCGGTIRLVAPPLRVECVAHRHTFALVRVSR